IGRVPLYPVEVDFVVGQTVQHRGDHHLEHDAGQRCADTAVRAEPEGDMAIGGAVQHHVPGALELGFVVVGSDPTYEQPIVSPQRLTAEHRVATDGSAQL